jgi:hypothetical protein
MLNFNVGCRVAGLQGRRVAESQGRRVAGSQSSGEEGHRTTIGGSLTGSTENSKISGVSSLKSRGAPTQFWRWICVGVFGLSEKVKESAPDLLRESFTAPMLPRKSGKAWTGVFTERFIRMALLFQFTAPKPGHHPTQALSSGPPNISHLPCP